MTEPTGYFGSNIFLKRGKRFCLFREPPKNINEGEWFLGQTLDFLIKDLNYYKLLLLNFNNY